MNSSGRRAVGGGNISPYVAVTTWVSKRSDNTLQFCASSNLKALWMFGKLNCSEDINYVAFTRIVGWFRWLSAELSQAWWKSTARTRPPGVAGRGLSSADRCVRALVALWDTALTVSVVNALHCRHESAGSSGSWTATSGATFCRALIRSLSQQTVNTSPARLVVAHWQYLAMASRWLH